MNLRVATYNIHGSRGRDGRRDTRRILDVLREIKADVMALQEIDEREGADIEARPLAYLAEQTGMHSAFAPTMKNDSGQAYGHAILSRFDLRDERLHDVSVAGREPRGLLEARVEPAAGSSLGILGFHLGLSSKERSVQIKRLLEVAPESPVLLLGDSNEWNEFSANLRRLRSRFGLEASGRTFPVGRPMLKLDRIWTGSAPRIVSVRVHRSETSRAASDHLPLVAEVELD